MINLNYPNVSINTLIKNFINKNKNIIHKYFIMLVTLILQEQKIIINKLSLERAETVKKILIGIGIDDSKIM